MCIQLSGSFALVHDQSSSPCDWYRVDTVSGIILCGTKWAVTPAPEPSVSEGACVYGCAAPGFSYWVLQGASLVELPQKGPSGTLLAQCVGRLPASWHWRLSRYAVQASSGASLSKSRKILFRYAGEDDQWHERLLLDRVAAGG